MDEHALQAALVSGRLAGAALDVVRPRHGGGEHPLAALDQVILTPHIGGATRETLVRGAQMIAEEIRRFAAGDPLVHVANRRGPPMIEPLTLAIDAGTGSCRAALFDEGGRQVALAQREWSHPAAAGVPGSQVFETDGELAADRRMYP